ncbi:transcriptional regulator [Vibrio coralliilyticus]|uniref:Transcriptional regulator n=1 Tax=Vibrio coralliilyticus TaxID=190893 RepID=A0A837GCG5_9VIBR|nr:outer membrane beta-barrel protein [Vibrio coralliilyticus]KJY74571.1 transcriptional regulator [Vibrio coralliilyticus]QOU28836.1 outer membrane beta-barrel protein [Vibrio coralliilyticus]
MQNKSLKLVTFGVLMATTAFTANASENYDYFIGLDAGARISGTIEVETNGVNQDQDMSSSAVFGLRGGVIFNNAHQLSLGYDYRGTSEENNSDSDLEVGTLYTRYDYLVPIMEKLSWTLGGKLGYEMFNASYDTHELDGVVLGAQTGLNYQFEQWSVGTEVSYLYHTTELTNEEGNTKTTSKLGDEVFLMTNIQYHF